MTKDLSSHITELLNSVNSERARAQQERRKALREGVPDEQKSEGLDQAAKILERQIVRLERQLRVERSHSEGADNVSELLAVLSQCLGSLGGTHRDAGRYDLAQASYERGFVFEKEFNAIAVKKRPWEQASYNLLQRLVARVLVDPGVLQRHAFREELAEARQEIVNQIVSGRFDSWARADEELVNALLFDGQGSSRTEGFAATGPFFESTGRLFAQLAGGVNKHDPALGQRLATFADAMIMAR